MARKSYTSKPRPVFQFDLDGVEFSAPGIGLLELAELGRLADLEADSAEGMAAIADFFRSVMGADYDRFRDHLREHHTDNETLLAIIGDAVQAVTDFPTQAPSDSSAGPTNTGRSLKVVAADGEIRWEQLTPEREAELAAAVARATG